MCFQIEKSTLMCFSHKAWRSEMTSYIFKGLTHCHFMCILIYFKVLTHCHFMCILIYFKDLTH